MSVSIVNGYVCFNCTDQEKAQKGIDPANPTNDPSQNKSAQTKRAEAIAVAKAELNQSQAANGSRTGTTNQPGTAQASTPPAAPAPLLPGIGAIVDLTA